MAGKGKRYNKAREAFADKQQLPLDEAVALVKNNATAKFDETVEIAINLGVDTRHAEQQVRGMIGLPNGVGKDVKVAVFARGAKADEAKKAGADIVGAEDLMEQVQKGSIDFDRCIATPDMMAVVGRLGKILGPRGLMPNPKLGTVSMDVAKAVEEAKAGQVEYRAEKCGIIHVGIGKASFTEVQIADNVRALVGAVDQARPSSLKGTYFKKISLASTMGPGISVDVSSALGAS